MNQKQTPPPRRKSLDGMRPKRVAASTPFPGVGTNLRRYQPTNSVSAPRRSLASRTEVGYKPKGRLRRIFRVKRIFIALISVLIITGIYLGGSFLYNEHKLFGGSILGLLSTTTLKGESSGRVNILLAGNSADDPGHNGANLTDSIMLISIDTKTNQAFLLSIPRDLWVDIPGGGHQKINAAYVVGSGDNFSQSGYPKGGMGLLEKVVSADFGIPIDYYALINYGALRDTVNDVGGITLTIHSSDPRGLYDPSIDYSTGGPLVRLSNGVHTLNGQQALDLARARGDSYGSYGFAQSDFERTANQRAMLLALKQKVTSAGVLTNPVALSDLFGAISSNVKTDLSLADVKRLYSLTKNDNGSAIKSLSLQDGNGPNLLTSYVAYDGEEALIPAAGIDNFSQIKQYIAQITSNNPIAKEGASVVVLNATNSYGVAAQQQQFLISKQVLVTHIGDANVTLPTSQIIDNSNGHDPATLALLKQRYGNDVTMVNPYGSLYTATFIVQVGEDKAATATGP